MRTPLLVSSGLSAALVLAGTHASASGISVARFGAEHGHPMTTNATSIYYNPAGIGKSDGGHGYVDVNTAWRHTTYDRTADASDAPVPAGAEGANTGEANLFNINVSPFIGATYSIAPIAVGLAYYTPFGGMSNWDKNDAFEGNTRFPGAVDGVQRWYSIEGEILSSFLSAAIAYDFGLVSVGLSGNLIRSTTKTIRARTPVGDNNIDNEGRSMLDVSSWDFSMGVGVLFEPIREKLRLGLSYQSQPNFGDGIVESGTLTTLFVNGVREENDVDLHTDLPDVIRAGASYRAMDDLELRLFGDYQRWSVLEDQCLGQTGAECQTDSAGNPEPGAEVIENQRRDWNDTFGVRAGVSYWLSKDVEGVAGAGFSSTAVPDSTLEPALVDFHSVSLAVGARFALGEIVHLGTTYTQVFYISRDTTGESIHPDLSGPSRNPDSGGEYAQQVGVLNVNVDVAF